MKVIIIGGYPGSGKSTIVKKALDLLVDEHGHSFRIMKYGKLVPYMESNKGLIVLGTYTEGEKFPGTDRFAMNVQPEVGEFFLELQRKEAVLSVNNPGCTVLFEGDRLFNDKMFTFFKAHDIPFVTCLVETQWEHLQVRRDARSRQNETWLRGRKTKVDNLFLKYGMNHRLLNTTLKDQSTSVEELVAEINGEWDKDPVGKTVKDFWK